MRRENCKEELASAEQSYAVAPRQSTQHQPQTQQTYGKNLRHPVQRYLPKQESVTAGSQIVTDLTELCDKKSE
jgi:hypothetical protein